MLYLAKYGRVKGIQVTYPEEHSQKLETLLENLFGHSPHFSSRGGIFHPENTVPFFEHLAGAVGAPRGSHLHLDHVSPSELQVTVRHPSGFVARRTFYKVGNETHLYNNFQDGTPIKGSGYRRTVGSINSLRKLGVTRVSLEAGGNKQTLSLPPTHIGHFSGYVAWPRMGFDGQIPDATWERLPWSIKRQMGNDRSLSKLHSIPGGREAWEQYGMNTKVYFKPFDKQYINRLVNYVKGRRQRDTSRQMQQRLSRMVARYAADPRYTKHLSR